MTRSKRMDAAPASNPRQNASTPGSSSNSITSWPLISTMALGLISSIRYPLFLTRRGLLALGCHRGGAGQQIKGRDFAIGQDLDLKGLRQADTTGSVEPVVDFALADRWPHPLAERGLRDAVLLKVVSESHISIMDHFKTD